MSCNANRVRDLLKPDEHKCCSCSKGPRGPQGPKGPNGDNGQQGKTGDDGVPGENGQDGQFRYPSPALLDFADYSTSFAMDSDFSIPIEQGDAIPFFDGDALLFSGRITKQSPFQFALVPAVYRITFRVPTMGPGALEIRCTSGLPSVCAFNGQSVVPGSQTGSNQACEIANTVLFSPKSLTVISIVNPGRKFQIPTKSGSTPLTYSLVIECIQDLPTNGLN